MQGERESSGFEVWVNDSAQMDVTAFQSHLVTFPCGCNVSSRARWWLGWPEDPSCGPGPLTELESAAGHESRGR